MTKTKILCPVQCKYCMASKIDIRSKEWEKGRHIGINKSCVFINRFLSDKPLEEMDIPWELFGGEYVGFQGVTDCFWDVYFEDLRFLCERIKNLPIKKLILTSKIPIQKKQIEVLEEIKEKVIVIYSVTGMDALEKTSTKDRVSSIFRLKSQDFDVLPIIHPYIHGYSDLSFLKDLSSFGCGMISWKGFRYNSKTMRDLLDFIPSEILSLYDTGKEDEVLVGDSFLQEQIAFYAMKYVDLKKYIQRESISGISFESASAQVKALMDIAVVSSSAKREEVLEYAVSRRL